MNLIDLLPELVSKHEKLIIPKLGAFITTNISAKVNQTDKSFQPPSKELKFDPKLTEDDGILIGKLKELLKITKREATKIVEHFVNECLSTLKEKRRYVIPNLGTLVMSLSGIIKFEQDPSANLSAASFGLPPLASVTKNQIKSNNMNKKKKTQTRGIWIVATIVLVLLLAVLYLLYDRGVFGGNDKTELIEESQPVVEETLVVTDTIAAESIEPEPVEPIVEKKYFVVAGCFEYLDNAERLVNNLQEAGYGASIAGQTPGGLHIVAYNGYENRQEAISQLNRIIREENFEAWLYEKGFTYSKKFYESIEPYEDEEFYEEEVFYEEEGYYEEENQDYNYNF